MARGATIYRVMLVLSNVDRECYAELSLTLAQHPSETPERLAVRLLAYGLRYEEGLEFGRGVSATDEPDAWSREPDGRIREWVEVGQPDAKRLVKAARRSDRVSVFSFGRSAQQWRNAQLAKLEAPSNLGVACIDADFVDRVAGSLDRTLHWSLTLSGGGLFLGVGDDTFETVPEVWIGAPLS